MLDHFQVISISHQKLDTKDLEHFVVKYSDKEELRSIEKLAHDISKVADYHQGAECIKHIFEVASSLQSLVIGEREIFRQFREAYEMSRQFGLTGDNLRLLERFTVNAAKDVYTSTKIGEKPVSVVSLALQSLLTEHL